MEKGKSDSDGKINEKKLKMRGKLKAIFYFGGKKASPVVIKSVDNARNDEKEEAAVETSTKEEHPKRLLQPAWGSSEKSVSDSSSEIDEPVQQHIHKSSKMSQLWKSISHRNIAKLQNEAASKTTIKAKSETLAMDVVSFEDEAELCSIANDNNDSSEENIAENHQDNNSDLSSLPILSESDIGSFDESTEEETTNYVTGNSNKLGVKMQRSCSASQLSSFEDDSSLNNHVNMFAAKSCVELRKPKTIGERFLSVFTMKKAAKKMRKGKPSNDDIKESLSSKKKGMFQRSKAIETHIPAASLNLGDADNYDDTLDLTMAAPDSLSSIATTCITNEVGDNDKKTLMYESDGSFSDKSYVSDEQVIATTKKSSVSDVSRLSLKPDSPELTELVENNQTPENDDEDLTSLTKKYEDIPEMKKSSLRKPSLTNSIKAIRTKQFKKAIFMTKVVNIFSRKKRNSIVVESDDDIHIPRSRSLSITSRDDIETIDENSEPTQASLNRKTIPVQSNIKMNNKVTISENNNENTSLISNHNKLNISRINNNLENNVIVEEAEDTNNVDVIVDNINNKIVSRSFQQSQLAYNLLL